MTEAKPGLHSLKSGYITEVTLMPHWNHLINFLQIQTAILKMQIRSIRLNDNTSALFRQWIYIYIYVCVCVFGNYTYALCVLFMWYQYTIKINYLK